MARKSTKGTAPAATNKRRHKDTGQALPDPAAPASPSQQQARPINSAAVDRPFAYNTPTPAKIEKMNEIRIMADDLYDSIQSAAREYGDSRYFSLARTALEEAVMWANKGISRG